MRYTVVPEPGKEKDLPVTRINSNGYMVVGDIWQKMPLRKQSEQRLL